MSQLPDSTWKEDFPYEQEEANHVSRREFAKMLGMLSGAFALGNAAIVVKSLAFPKDSMKGMHLICSEGEMAVGEFKSFLVEGNEKVPYILIRLAENEWRAFEQKCTHLSCAVRYRHDLKQIECPCHKGYFDPYTGAVMQGPPPRPLPQLLVKVQQGKVYVTGMPETEQKA